MTEPGASPPSGQPLLRVRGLHKRFGETHALRGVDFEGAAGEIHAIVGENGAGKSTLMRILSGALRPDAGELVVDGSAAELANPLDARDLGIWAVYQEFSLVGHLSVTENLLLGRLAGQGRRRLRPKSMLTEARAMTSELGFELDLRARVDQLSVSQRQMVEIAKALAERPRILILDEPSAVLAREQLERLFGLLRDLVARGSLVLYVSHRFDEIFEIADRMTVLKDGEVVSSLRPSETDQRELINLMVGRDVDDVFPDRDTRGTDELLRVDGLGRPPDFEDVSFELAGGEVVGLFGLVGSGRTELARALFGAEPATSGRMTLGGSPYAPQQPSDGLASGLAYLTEDRGHDGLLMTESIRTNMTLAVVRRLTARGLLRPGREETVVAPQFEELAVRAPRSTTPVRHLSGGNQQKVLLARALLTDSRVLVLDEPTRGVDVGTRIQIYATIARLAEAGAAVLIISSELVEILGLCDRVLVMRKGRLVAEFPSSAATESSVLAAASGVAA